MRKFLLIGVSTFALGAAAMAYADQVARRPDADTYKMLELFGDVLATVEDQYVVPVDNKKLIQAAIDGMLKPNDRANNRRHERRKRDDGRANRTPECRCHLRLPADKEGRHKERRRPAAVVGETWAASRVPGADGGETPPLHEGTP
mgnify:CR=1 FL=1